MGADARWVCHTCKTVCPRGGRPVLRYGTEYSVEEVESILGQVVTLSTSIEEVYLEKDVIVFFLNDLKRWLTKHEGHVIYIGSDYSTDMMDLDNYYDETVDGKKGSMTRHEVQMGCLQDLEERALEDIKETIRKHEDDLDAAARELYNKFSVSNL